ncbi:hypothetical protein OGCDGJMD_00510 [Cyanobium usitatum str. Tous]|jgi:hypothetical protein|nr:hypothetical protein OGCDGJMD_00510 [Cyanobium usitatum str. Tous]
MLQICGTLATAVDRLTQFEVVFIDGASFGIARAQHKLVSLWLIRGCLIALERGDL